VKIELRPIDSIKPYKRNPRVNEKAVEPVAASIREFGFRQPVVVDEKQVIIVGHVRWLAAKSLGLEKIPVHVARELTPAQVRAYRIADNKLHELATWNFELLSVELASVKSSGLDVRLLGFDERELMMILARGQTAAEVDDIPAPPDKATTRPGDFWILGEHRLLCGDSANPADVARVTAGRKIHLFNSDPPYNVNVEPRSHNALKAAGKKTHHQQLDLARKPGARATSSMMRA
jgi:hypothetical protein